jgi:peptidoglycan/LPS O-acetylase OafA/YrhL
MTATAIRPVSPTTSAATPSLWRTGATAGAAAAVATVAIAGAASGLDVPLDTAPGETIPLFAFAQLTLICTFVGGLMARAIDRRASRPRTTLMKVTVALTAISLLPDLTIAAGASTKVTLMLTHLVAAAIVIPALASCLPANGRRAR